MNRLRHGCHQPFNKCIIRTRMKVNHQSPASDKIALFRSLFRGREDVYPRRFESRRTQKSGYQPACGNEWVRGVCEKPRIKCGDCSNQAWLPVTDETVRWHLSGHDDQHRPFVLGVYPMLLDETCHFLAVDFDGEQWRADAGAYLDVARQLHLPASLERSRSGNGGHVWFFFERAVPASLTRNMGARILTLAMEGRPDIGLRSYDRMFPNQDTLPKGGFGNLIALPLQKAPREKGNSVFLDDGFTPYQDQWAYLSGLSRVPEGLAKAVVRDAGGWGGIVGVRLSLADDEDDEPWTTPPSRRRRDPPLAGPLPEKLELVLGDQVYIAKESLPPSLRNRLVRMAAFQNPEFYKAQSMRLSTYGKPRVICCAEDHPKHISLPRGCLEEVREVLRSLKIRAVMRDERTEGNRLGVTFQGRLRPEQKLAAEALMASDTGVLAATTAFGKTVIGAWLIAHRGVSTLILVNRRQLLEQWLDRLSSFLEIPRKEIGQIGGGRRKPNGKLDVALVQSLVRKETVNDCVGDYGFLLVDECHHVPSRSFELLAKRAKARYVTGLSATVTRKDGHHPIIFMQCGPVRYRVDAKAQAAMRPFVHNVIVRPTGFRSGRAEEEDRRMEFQALSSDLIVDKARNEQICNDVVAAVAEGRSPVVLTERTEHLDLLAEALSSKVPNLIVLQGGMGKKQLTSAMNRLAAVPESEPRVLLATGKYLGEGFDDSRLDTMFLTSPVSWRGTIAQYAGRLHRLHDGKREVRVYDYADLDVPMLARMFDRRCQGYEAVGYSIMLPASAVPGWPQEVPLPVDPEWKRDYAASVQRLIRDGVDAPLGNLFVYAARAPMAEAEGIDRARSASEAFLFRRLETLEKTAGRFRLNVELPIPFGGQGKMEVDFLAETAGVVVEIDGAHHFSDPEAYRCDRRKDVLLQENGYFVLRFLAEDLGKRLNDVLDTILRTLEHRLRPLSGTVS
jgi:superfamily II DNA or RNA helicase/very-short-patch-repair endonuclease